MLYNNKIDVIIPVYNAPDEMLFKCLSSIACQEIIEDIEVTIVDDASNIETNYQKVADNFKSMMKINILRYDINGGPGVARQYGIDHTSNEFITFIDVDDTFNGAFALKALRGGIQLNDNQYQVCIGVFDEIFTEKIPNGQTFLIAHEEDLVWMFGKMYRRSFIEKYDIHFHATSRANEDNGFNAQVQLYTHDLNLINFISTHVYIWHENLDSITRKNNCNYTFGDAKRDSFYGYVENMIFAIKEVQRKNIPDRMEVIKSFAVVVMIKLYQYYIECYAKANQYAANNFEYCKKYYNELYQFLEKEISTEFFTQHYSELMTTFYAQGKFDNIVPHMSIQEFLRKLKR